MKVKKIDVYWNNDFSNLAKLQIYVDEVPDYSKIMKYECRKDRLYYAYDEETGLVDFNYDDPNDHNGYGGRKFEYNMKDGSKVTLVGPWSSRPAVMHSAGFPLCTSVTLKEDRYKYCGVACHMLNSKLIELIKEWMPMLKFYVAANGEIFIPKNQLLNSEFKGSCAERRGDRDPDPPEYNPAIGVSENYGDYSLSGEQERIVRS